MSQTSVLTVVLRASSSRKLTWPLIRPHALLSQELLQCKPGELEKLCGPYYAQILGSAKGCGLLRDAQSIMRYDIPAALCTKGIDLLQGGRVIDKEALALVRSLYPPVPESTCFTFNAGQLPGFQAGWNGGATGKRFFSTAHTTNVVTGIRRVDMGINGNFRLISDVADIQRGSGYTLEMGAWADTHLIDATCDVLSFDEADQRIRTGRVNWHHLSGGNERSYRETFSRPFNMTPNVVVFISGFDTLKGRNIRIDVSPSAIDKNGFTVNIKTWAGESRITCSLSAEHASTKLISTRHLHLQHRSLLDRARTGRLDHPVRHPRPPLRSEPDAPRPEYQVLQQPHA